MATETQIDDALGALAVAYPLYDKNQANPILARKVFHRILKDIDGALLEAAIYQWLSTARPFHPSPGELRDMALTLTERDSFLATLLATQPGWRLAYSDDQAVIYTRGNQ